MSASQRYVGKDLVVHFIYSGGTVTLSGDQTAMNVNMVTGSADVSAGNDVYRQRIPTLTDNNADMTSFSIGANGTATWGVLSNGTQGTLVYYPQGTASGLPKGGFPAFIANKNHAYPFEGGVTLNVTFMGQGGTYGTNVFDPSFHTA